MPEHLEKFRSASTATPDETLSEPWLARVRHRLYIILEAGKTSDLPSLIFDIFMMSLICANVVIFAMETVDEFSAENRNWIGYFNTISILIFTIEYCARLWVCVEFPLLRPASPLRARFIWAKTPYMLVDLLVILPFYLGFFFAIDLRVLRVFRLLRFLKLIRFSPALTTLGRVIVNESRALVGAIVIMIGLLLCAATLIHWVEGDVQPDAFGSIPRSMWWALSTLTTVGYGDVVPITVAGRIVGGVVMILGLGMFALPVAILSSSFAQEIHRREFVVSWGMLARVPLFQGLTPLALGEMLDLLQSQIVPTGAVIGHEGERADGMYFIVLGHVDVIFPDFTMALHEGEFFGEGALLSHEVRSASIVAKTRCHLLRLPVRDFEHFIARNPAAHETILRVAEERKILRTRQGADQPTDGLAQELVDEKSRETKEEQGE